MSNVFKYALRLIFSTILIVVGTSPYLLLIFVPLSAGWWVLQKYYRASARELQRLSSISRSPIYSAFNESLNGAATVQAFGDVERFASEQCERFDYNQRAYTSRPLGPATSGLSTLRLASSLPLCSLYTLRCRRK